MRNERLVIGVVVLLAIGIILFLYYKPTKLKSNLKWHKTLDRTEKEPYDLGLFKKMLIKSSGEFTELRKEIKYTLGDEEANANATYIFVNQYYYLTSEEVGALLKFVSRGNNAMIIAEGLPDTLLNALNIYGLPLSLEMKTERSVRVETLNTSSAVQNYVARFRGYEPEDRIDWHYLKEDEKFKLGIFPTSYIVQSTINKHINQVTYSYGKGRLVINTTPILFSNYMMRSDTAFKYVNEMLTNFNLEKVYFDVYSSNYKDDAERMQRNSASPLSYILAHKELKYAWYLLLLTVVLFLLFRAKRVQRIIPVLATKRNTTVAFVETLSGLYYSQANHREMASTKMQLFLFFIRTKLNIPTHELNDRVIRQISQKSGVSFDLVDDIFEYYKNRIETTDELSSESLLEFYNKINQFYKTYNRDKK